MNNSKHAVAKACLQEFRACYSDLLIAAQRLEHSLESLSMDVLEIGPENPEVAAIMRMVAIEYELKISTILSPLRTAVVAEARHLAMLIAREQTKLGFEDLGLIFRRDHGGVLHGVRRAKELCETDHVIRDRYHRLTNALSQAA
jgi:chromosomal replication initiation ATPase DnaA